MGLCKKKVRASEQKKKNFLSFFQMDINGNFVSSSLTDGSVSAPSEYFKGEPSTGIYREVTNPSTTAFAISKRGTKRLRVSDTGVDVTGALTASSFSGGSLTTTSLLTTASTNQIQIQPGGSGNTFTVTASTPAQNTTLTLADPGVSSTSLITGVMNVVSISNTATLTTAQSRYLVALSGGSGSYGLSLPTPKAGLLYRCVITATLPGGLAFQAGSAQILGSVLSSDGTAVSGGNITSAKTYIILSSAAVIGDTYEFWSEGTHWFVRGITAAHGSVSFL